MISFLLGWGVDKWLDPKGEKPAVLFRTIVGFSSMLIVTFVLLLLYFTGKLFQWLLMSV